MVVEVRIMLTAVEGYYKDGKVELAETPVGIKEAKVIVTFVEPTNGKPEEKGQMIYRGMFKGLIQTTEEDFKLAEWHGDDEDI
jgi:hypothetical protein